MKNRKHKTALTKLRISAHRLHIEKGRYKRYDNNLKQNVTTPIEQRTCSVWRGQVKIEYQFLLNVRKTNQRDREIL